MFGFRKSIKDNIKDFDSEYKAVQMIQTQYLILWFKQIFKSPPYDDLFKDNPNFCVTLATEVVKYLSGQDPKEETWNGEETDKETYQMAKSHAEKWADDVMKRDLDFCRLRVQTLRLEFIYGSHANGIDFSSTPKGKRISELLMKYGALVPEEVNPKDYTRLVEKWIKWSKDKPWN